MRGIRPARAGPGTLTSVRSLKGEEAGNSDPRKLLPSSLLLRARRNHTYSKETLTATAPPPPWHRAAMPLARPRSRSE